MTNRELQDKLAMLDPDLPVIISDGYNSRFYTGDFIVTVFTDLDNSKVVDIGIGGFEITEE